MYKNTRYNNKRNTHGLNDAISCLFVSRAIYGQFVLVYQTTFKKCIWFKSDRDFDNLVYNLF